ncbi:FAD-dependent oxidoreductase [Zavarzinella formosa]|uniref:FAD-dependent oxidoreductase n=1 Tax=Zavarzinella formosa TaxID=360055 RepID=UPI00031F6F98|nr:FAD-dependent oxidoreductase [Zavarzinella formosa]
MTARFLPLVAFLVFAGNSQAIETDVCVYGGTAAGVTASIQAAKMGKTVVLIEPTTHIGGLTSGGLGYTDSGDKRGVGGLSREFYQRVKTHYDQPASWTQEKPENYKLYRTKEDTMWTFEPKVAERILREMLKEHKITVVTGQRLDRGPKGVALDGKRITSFRTTSGETYSAKMFIDATYEGDLMAAAGVSYTVGREPNSKYGETLNGVQRAQNIHMHRFVVKVDPYVTPGDPKSGLLFGIDKELPKDGDGDHRLQAFCFRMCMSNAPANRIPFPKPADYDEKMYELLFRNFAAGDLRFPMKPDMMPNGKTDTNNNCAFSTDFIGQNHAYPDATDAEREKIIAAHRTYQQGLMWTLANHPRVPEKIRTEMAKWGLPKDEFTDNGNWPHQIYVREARRLVSDYVATEADCRRKVKTPQPVGLGSYNMDSHNCARYVTSEGFVQNEGDVQVSPGGAYQISYLSLVPKKGECPNLVVPVCLASSHIAYGSIRMEPVFMLLGQSAATAAVIAMEDGVPVQEVSYDKLKTILLKDGQVLDIPSQPAAKGAIDPKTLPGIVVDDEQAEREGFGTISSANPPFVGTGYRHDGNTDRGKQSITYTPKLPADGQYEVRMSYSQNANRATNVPVTIMDVAGATTKTVNEQKAPPINGTWISLGTVTFEKGKPIGVKITNKDADGYVVVDAVMWIPVKK